MKGLFREGFRTLRTAGEVYRWAETLDEVSGVIPQLAKGATTVDQAGGPAPRSATGVPGLRLPVNASVAFHLGSDMRLGIGLSLRPSLAWMEDSPSLGRESQRLEHGLGRLDQGGERIGRG